MAEAASPPPVPRLPCPQCAAPIQVADDLAFRSCAHCGATLFLDLEHLVLHAYVLPRLEARAVAGALERFLRALEITFPAAQVRAELQYVPFAVFAGPDRIRSVPLASIGSRSLPFDAPAFAGALQPYDEADARGHILEPEEPLDDARLRADAAPSDKAQLVHVPFYRVRYVCAGRRYEAVISALDGAGHAEVLPPPSSAQLDKNYATWAALALLTFTLEAFLMPSFTVAMAVVAPTIFVFWWLLTGVQGAHR